MKVPLLHKAVGAPSKPLVHAAVQLTPLGVLLPQLQAALATASGLPVQVAGVLGCGLGDGDG